MKQSIQLKKAHTSCCLDDKYISADNRYSLDDSYIRYILNTYVDLFSPAKTNICPRIKTFSKLRLHSADDRLCEYISNIKKGLINISKIKKMNDANCFELLLDCIKNYEDFKNSHYKQSLDRLMKHIIQFKLSSVDQLEDTLCENLFNKIEQLQDDIEKIYAKQKKEQIKSPHTIKKLLPKQLNLIQHIDKKLYKKIINAVLKFKYILAAVGHFINYLRIVTISKFTTTDSPYQDYQRKEKFDISPQLRALDDISSINTPETLSINMDIRKLSSFTKTNKMHIYRNEFCIKDDIEEIKDRLSRIKKFFKSKLLKWKATYDIECLTPLKLEREQDIPCKICGKSYKTKILNKHSLNCKLKMEMEQKLGDVNRKLSDTLSEIVKQKRNISIDITVEKHALIKIKNPNTSPLRKNFAISKFQKKISQEMELNVIKENMGHEDEYSPQKKEYNSLNFSSNPPNRVSSKFIFDCKPDVNQNNEELIHMERIPAYQVNPNENTPPKQKLTFQEGVVPRRISRIYSARADENDLKKIKILREKLDTIKKCSMILRVYNTIDNYGALLLSNDENSRGFIQSSNELKSFLHYYLNKIDHDLFKENTLRLLDLIRRKHNKLKCLRDVTKELCRIDNNLLLNLPIIPQQTLKSETKRYSILKPSKSTILSSSTDDNVQFLKIPSEEKFISEYDRNKNKSTCSRRASFIPNNKLKSKSVEKPKRSLKNDFFIKYLNKLIKQKQKSSSLMYLSNYNNDDSPLRFQTENGIHSLSNLNYTNSPDKSIETFPSMKAIINLNMHIESQDTNSKDPFNNLISQQKRKRSSNIFDMSKQINADSVFGLSSKNMDIDCNSISSVESTQNENKLSTTTKDEFDLKKNLNIIDCISNEGANSEDDDNISSGLLDLSNLSNSRESSVHEEEYFSDTECKSKLVPESSKDMSSFITIEDFEFLKLISKGAFGRVWLVRRKITQDIYAMKIINFADRMNRNQIDSLHKEKTIFQRIDGDFFVKALFTFVHENFLCIVMEFLIGGDLGGLIERLGVLDEISAKFYIAEIILAVDSLHKLGIIHRDLKPDNILLDSRGHIKLTDFGLSDLGLENQLYHKNSLIDANDKKFSMNKSSIFIPPLINEKLAKLLRDNEIKSNSNIKSNEGGRRRSTTRRGITTAASIKPRLGTPDYMAPEIIKGTQNNHPCSDWWSVGVLLFEFLVGIPPFNDVTVEKVFKHIENREIPWDEVNIGYEPDCITPQAKDLINRLLELNLKNRLGYLGVEEIKSHEFFNGLDWDEIINSTAPIIPETSNNIDVSYFKRDGKVYNDSEMINPFLTCKETLENKDEIKGMIIHPKEFEFARLDLLHLENQKSVECINQEIEKVKKRERDSLTRRKWSVFDQFSMNNYSIIVAKYT